MIGGVSAVVLIKAETSRVNELAQKLVELKGVAEVFSVAGQYDLVAIVRAAIGQQGVLAGRSFLVTAGSTSPM